MIGRVLNCVATMVMVAGGFLAWCVVAPSLTGAPVPNSIAATIRGGGEQCTNSSVSAPASCKAGSTKTCDEDETDGCTTGTFFSVSGTDQLNFGLEGDDFCCGSSSGGCSPVSPKFFKCGHS